MPTQADTIDKIRSIVQDAAQEAGQRVLSNFMTYVNAGLEPALSLFSKDSPREAVYEFIGNNQDKQVLPSDWDYSISGIKEIILGSSTTPVDQNEYMVVKNDATERGLDNVSEDDTSITLSTAANAGFIKNGDLILIANQGDADTAQTNWASADGNTTTGVVTIKNAASADFTSTPVVKKLDTLHFLITTPGLTTVVKVKYDARHIHNDSTDTLPDNDYPAFCSLAASKISRTISTFYSHKQSGSLSVDQVDYGAAAAAWLEIANSFKAEYNDYMNKGHDQKPRTNVDMIDIDTDSRRSKGSYIYHGRRRF